MAGDKSTQTFSFGTVACLLAAMAESGVIVGHKHYNLMHQIDPSKTVSGYEHYFRAAKAEAKAINDRVAKGELSVDGAAGAKKGGTPAKKGTPGKEKTAKRGRKDNEIVEQENDDDDEESPLKKKKEEVKEEDFGMFAADLP